MNIKDLIGDFSVIGKNQNNDNEAYKGTLSLSLDKNKRIIAKWIISQNQEQFGTGFFKDNILVINFNYKGIDHKSYTGVAVYKCLNKDILEGFWSEELGDPNFLGTENCFRVKKELIN